MENKSNLRIAVIKPDGIGDVVLASPFFLGLRKHYTDAHITAYLSPVGARVLDGLNCFDNVTMFDAQWIKYNDPKPFYTRWISALKLIIKLNCARYDMVIGLRSNERLSSLIVSLSNAKQRYGYNIGGMGFSINHVVSYPPQTLHVTEKNMLMLKAITGEKYPAIPELKTDDKSEESIISLLKKGNINKFVVFHPVSGNSSKDWGIEKFIELAKSLSKYFKILVIGAKEDNGINRLKAPDVENMAGMLTIGEIKALIKNAQLVIGNDSMAVHIASALGVKSLTIFSGSARYQEWGAYGDKSYIIDHHVKCSPCSLVNCNRKKECLDISVDFVAQTALQIMNCKQEQLLISYKT